MSIEAFLYEHPVFRYEEFAAFKAEQGTVNSISVKSALRYYSKIGKIKSLRRGLYAVIPPNLSSETLSIDPYLVAGKVTQDAVIAYHSALELMGSAYSIFGQLTYLTAQKSKPFEYAGNWFQPVSFSTALRKKEDENRYVETVNRQGISIKITNPARTFVDVLDRVELCGGWEEVYRSIANLVVLNIQEVIDYCLLLENACLNAKVGYFLSQRRGAFSVTEKDLVSLLAGKPKTPQQLSGFKDEKLHFIKQWNIYLPESVVTQSWEEPDAEV